MKVFVTSRLQDAITRSGNWKNVDEKTLENAIRFLDDIENKKVNPKGIVVNVDYVLTQYPRERYYEWADGLGAEIFEDSF